MDKKELLRPLETARGYGILADFNWQNQIRRLIESGGEKRTVSREQFKNWTLWLAEQTINRVEANLEGILSYFGIEVNEPNGEAEGEVNEKPRSNY